MEIIFGGEHAVMDTKIEILQNVTKAYKML